jgi:hypothetical protein
MRLPISSSLLAAHERAGRTARGGGASASRGFCCTSRSALRRTPQRRFVAARPPRRPVGQGRTGRARVGAQPAQPRRPGLACPLHSRAAPAAPTHPSCCGSSLPSRRHDARDGRGLRSSLAAVPDETGGTPRKAVTHDERRSYISVHHVLRRVHLATAPRGVTRRDAGACGPLRAARGPSDGTTSAAASAPRGSDARPRRCSRAAHDRGCAVAPTRRAAWRLGAARLRAARHARARGRFLSGARAVQRALRVVDADGRRPARGVGVPGVPRRGRSRYAASVHVQPCVSPSKLTRRSLPRLTRSVRRRRGGDAAARGRAAVRAAPSLAWRHPPNSLHLLPHF